MNGTGYIVSYEEFLLKTRQSDKKNIIFGTSRFAESVICELRSNKIDIDLACDNNEKKWGKDILGVKIISIDELKQIKGRSRVLIASMYHKEIYNQLLEYGIDDIFYIPENDLKNAKYRKNVSIGLGTIVSESTKFDFIQETLDKVYVTIGKECYIENNFIFEKQSGLIKVGDRCSIGRSNITSINEIEIGNDVIISYGCTIYDHDSHSVYWEERMNDVRNIIADINSGVNFIKNKDWKNVKAKKVKICDKVWIGFNSTILKGVTIGEGAVVGANSVVTKEVEPYTVVAGNPAKVVKRLK
ncbi:acyltransferase [Clostridium saccharoperbutylacetonicum]|uniref:acyltransferase n=1 Tax=Clostridium saccharoperbutylacetonicum TaxID=36745 RepID=UPI0039EC745F